MTFRISQFAVVLGLSVLALPGVAQAPRYQSPLNVPTAPEPQLSLPTPAPITPNATVVEDVVARVNDQIINRSDVERAQQELAREDQQSNATPAEAAQRQRDLLRDMIDKQLLLSKGKELGLNADAEVIRRLDEIRKQNHLDSMEALEKAAAAQGVSFEDFKANIRDSVITQQVVRDEVGRRLQMTQGQEQAYYDAHKQDFAVPEQVRLSEILIPTAADANDAALAQAKAKADDVEAKIKAGDKFDELAKTYSSGSTAAQGGDLGLYKRGALPKVLEDQTFDLQPGQVTAPIRTRQGFVILKVTEHQAAGTPPLKEVEPQVQEAMYMEQLQPALRAYLTKLREDAFIDLAPGFVDSGASANETKPQFTAYAPPVSKKMKKVQKKERFDRSNGSGRFAAQGKRSSAPPATAVATSVASVAPAANGKQKKTKKIKREKVRFGQAPRNPLPAGPQETAVGGDVGAGAASASAITAAPGAAMTNSEESASQAADVNPLTPVAPQPTTKTRFASREKIVIAEKKAARRRKAKEKAAATPEGPTALESADRTTQSAPLGLNGDTAKKKKKVKVKGAKKERLENKPKPSTAPPPPPAPTVNPSLGEGLGTAPAAAQPSTPPASTTPN
ncbi:peptidyl-prolyl cis-trans isomerase [Edaphobacter paludis]|uniref:peptidylprolyl isomerase n=1 Tax=Edaphobacter paludis TaxID=3035702 RepID=A0AAU7D9S3_9BACT